MSSSTYECPETTAGLGEPFEEVHCWLDESAGKPPYGMRHRKLRHHLAGIEQMRKLRDDQAAEAGRLHIIADLKQEGWTEDQPFPRDEQDYQRMGFSPGCWTKGEPVSGSEQMLSTFRAFSPKPLLPRRALTVSAPGSVAASRPGSAVMAPVLISIWPETPDFGSGGRR